MQTCSILTSQKVWNGNCRNQMEKWSRRQKKNPNNNNQKCAFLPHLEAQHAVRWCQRTPSFTRKDFFLFSFFLDLNRRTAPRLACVTGAQGFCELEPCQEKQDRVPRWRSQARCPRARADMCHICSRSRAINRWRDDIVFTAASRMIRPGGPRRLSCALSFAAGRLDLTRPGLSWTSPPVPGLRRRVRVQWLFVRTVNWSLRRSSRAPRQHASTRLVSKSGSRPLAFILTCLL